jgi:hypothetical protein
MPCLSANHRKSMISFPSRQTHHLPSSKSTWFWSEEHNNQSEEEIRVMWRCRIPGHRLLVTSTRRQFRRITLQWLAAKAMPSWLNVRLFWQSTIDCHDGNESSVKLIRQVSRLSLLRGYGISTTTFLLSLWALSLLSFQWLINSLSSQPTLPSLDFLSIQQASKQAIQQRTQQASKEANCSATKQASQCYPASKQTSSSDQQSSSDWGTKPL